MPSTIGYYLVILGAINWGLVGIGAFFGLNLNVVSLVAGAVMFNALENIVYIIIGIAGVMTLVGCKCATCTACRADAGMQKEGNMAAK